MIIIQTFLIKIFFILEKIIKEPNRKYDFGSTKKTA